MERIKGPFGCPVLPSTTRVFFALQDKHVQGELFSLFKVAVKVNKCRSARPLHFPCFRLGCCPSPRSVRVYPVSDLIVEC
jgi:hypothetical protein